MGELVQRNNDLFQKGDYYGWSHSEVIANGITGDPVKIKATGRGTTNGTVQVVCGSNTGKVQFTLDTFELIDAATAEWTDWDKGEVTTTQTDVFIGAITGLRGVSVSGEITFKILI